MLNIPNSVLAAMSLLPTVEMSTPGTEMNEPARTINSMSAVKMIRSRSSSIAKAFRRLERNLFIDCHASASLLDLGASGCRQLVSGHGELRCEIAIAENLHWLIPLRRQSELKENLGRDNAILQSTIVDESLKSVEVDFLIVDTEWIVEAELRNTSDERHLASLEVCHALVSASRLRTLVTFGRGAAVTGSLAAP